MFDMDEFLKDLDDQNIALESMLSELDADTNTYDEYDEAMEGLFKKPKSVDKLLASLNKTINKKCKTAEDCDAMLENISSEESAFNDALTAMKEAAQAFKDGTITKKEMGTKIKAEAKKLKKTCSILKLSDINDKTDNVTDEELQNLKDFLVGAKEAINAKKSEFSGDTAEEGAIMSYLDDAWENLGNEDDIAQESASAAMAAASGALNIGSFALAVIGMAFALRKSGVVMDAKTINMVRKKLKPDLKRAKEEFKQAKKRSDWGKCVAALKKQEKINDQLYAVVKKLTPLSESSSTTSYSDGKTKETRRKKYNLTLSLAQDHYKKEKDYLMKKIALYTEKAKSPAGESTLDFDAGFSAAIEAMGMIDDDFDDEVAALESDVDDIAGLFDDDDDFGDLTI